MTNLAFPESDGEKWTHVETEKVQTIAEFWRTHEF